MHHSCKALLNFVCSFLTELLTSSLGQGRPVGAALYEEEDLFGGPVWATVDWATMRGVAG